MLFGEPAFRVFENVNDARRRCAARHAEARADDAWWPHGSRGRARICSPRFSAGRAGRLGLGARASALVVGSRRALHAVGFYGLHLQNPPVPLTTFPAALSLIGWGRGARLARRAARPRHARSRSPGSPRSPPVFTVLAALGLRSSAPHVDAREGAGIWSHAHVLLASAGFSLLGAREPRGARRTSRSSAASSAGAPLARRIAVAREPRPRRARDPGARLPAAHARASRRASRGALSQRARSVEPRTRSACSPPGRVSRSGRRARRCASSAARGRRAAWCSASCSSRARYIGISVLGAGP